MKSAVLVLCLTFVILLLVTHQHPQTNTEVVQADSNQHSRSQYDLENLEKDFAEVKTEAKSVLVLAQTDPSQRHCVVYFQYARIVNLQGSYDKFEKLNTSLPRALVDFDSVLKERAQAAVDHVYEKVRIRQSLGCSEADSNIVEVITRARDDYYPEKILNPDLVRDAELRELKPEIKSLTEDYKASPDDKAVKAQLMMTIQHAENVWHFTRVQLGVSQQLQDELFPIF